MSEVWGHVSQVWLSFPMTPPVISGTLIKHMEAGELKREIHRFQFKIISIVILSMQRTSWSYIICIFVKVSVDRIFNRNRTECLCLRITSNASADYCACAVSVVVPEAVEAVSKIKA